MNDQMLGFLTLGIVVVSVIAFILYQRRSLAKQEAGRCNGAKDRNWRYKPLSPKDSTFRLSGATDDVSWTLEHQKINHETWTCEWSTNSVRYTDGHVSMGTRSEVGFLETFFGRMTLRYMVWRIKKEAPEEAESIGQLKEALKQMCLVELQRPLLRKNYLISVPCYDKDLALLLFDTKVQEMLEKGIKTWPEGTGKINYDTFTFELTEEEMKMKINKKLAKFELTEQFVTLGLLLTENYRRGQNGHNSAGTNGCT